MDSAPLAETDLADERSYRMTFMVMCIAFGMNHAAVTTPVGYATSLLGGTVGSATNAVLYAVCLFSSLFLGPLITSVLGPKWGLNLGMILYCVYVLCFALATGYVDTVKDADDKDVLEPQQIAWVLALGGASIGGIGAGSLWTAQGAFFNAIAEKISEVSGTPLQTLTAELAATFALWYLGQECFWKSLFTVLTVYTPLNNTTAFILYAGLAASAVVLMAFGRDARPKSAAQRGPLCARALAAVSMWGDPKIWLLSGLNITFGFSAAYVNGYVNKNFLAQALPKELIGFLGAIICAIATVSSKVYGVLAVKMGTKMPIVVTASVSFLVIAVLSFITAPNGEGPGGWGGGIVVFYILQGMGRGAYESTNKGIFADFFPGEQGVGAFANCMMQNTASGTIGFVMGSVGAGQSEVWILIVGAILTVPGLALASSMRNSSQVETK